VGKTTGNVLFDVFLFFVREKDSCLWFGRVCKTAYVCFKEYWMIKLAYFNYVDAISAEDIKLESIVDKISMDITKEDGLYTESPLRLDNMCIIHKTPICSCEGLVGGLHSIEIIDHCFIVDIEATAPESVLMEALLSPVLVAYTNMLLIPFYKASFGFILAMMWFANSVTQSIVDPRLVSIKVLL